MCRMLAHLGEPVSLRHLLFDTDSSLVRQSYSPRMMNTFLNLAGFGMAAWEPRSAHAEEPFLYRTTTLPAFDRNLRGLAQKLEPTCVVAHVRGVTHAVNELVGGANRTPSGFSGEKVMMAEQRPSALFQKDVRPARGPVPPRSWGQRSRARTDWELALDAPLLWELDDLNGTLDAPSIAAATIAASRGACARIRVR